MVFSCVSSGRARTASASRTDTAPRRWLTQPRRDAWVSRELYVKLEELAVIPVKGGKHA